MHGGSRPPRITFLHFPSQIERIDDELALLTLFAVNSNHLLVPPSLLCIRHHNKLTTGPLTSGRAVVNLVFSLHHYLESKYNPGKKFLLPTRISFFLGLILPSPPSISL